RSLNWREDRHGPYHDLAVQVSGPICAELQRHLSERWNALSSLPLPDPRPPWDSQGGHAVYLSRTQQAEAGQGDRVVREIEFLLRDLIASAEHSLVLEGQYFWSRMITEFLISKMHAMRGQRFELTLVLAELARSRSFTRKMAPYEMKLLERLQDAAE